MTWLHWFVASAVLKTDGVEKLQNAFVRGRQLCTQLSIFEGSLAELLCFWCCQLRKLRKSRRIVSFLTLSSEKIEEVSQNCYVFWCCQVQKAEGVSQNSFVFKLGDRQIDRQLQSITTTTTTTTLNYDYNDNYTCKYTTLHCTMLITLHYTTLHYTNDI